MRKVVLIALLGGIGISTGCCCEREHSCIVRHTVATSDAVTEQARQLDIARQAGHNLCRQRVVENCDGSVTIITIAR